MAPRNWQTERGLGGQASALDAGQQGQGAGQGWSHGRLVLHGVWHASHQSAARALQGLRRAACRQE
eukprot:4974821-Alexandrium_andersonii.AAC.1